MFRLRSCGKGRRSVSGFGCCLFRGRAEKLSGTNLVLAFGARAIGETASETVVLHAPGGEDFSVIETTADSVDVEIHQVVSDESVRGDSVFLISQRINELRNHVSTVSFLVQVASAEVPINIPVTPSYFGLR